MAPMLLLCLGVLGMSSSGAVSLTVRSSLELEGSHDSVDNVDALKTAFANSLQGGMKELESELEMRKDVKRWAKELAIEKEKPLFGNELKIAARTGDGEVGRTRKAKMVDWMNALGPVLPCPAGMLQTFGSTDKEVGHQSCIDAHLGKSQDPCVVLSVGSANRYAFEADIVKQRSDCKIHTFDCFVEEPKVPDFLKDHVTFHQICIAPKNYSQYNCGTKNNFKKCGADGKKTMDYEQIAQLVGLTSPPTILKMDVEGFEFPVMEDIAVLPKSIKPTVVSMELHFRNLHGNFLPWPNRTVADVQKWTTTLLSKGGYVLASAEQADAFGCAEVAYSQLDM